MGKNIGNVCIRCGKERIVVKTWKVMVGNFWVTYTDTACPDTSCQKEVEKILAARKEKIKKFADAKNQLRLSRNKG